MDNTHSDYTLYGVELSLYTGKVRSYLRYKGVDWQEKMPSLEDYNSWIVPKAGGMIIPVMMTADDEFVQDTTDIIDFVEAREGTASVYPETPKQKLAALLLEFFGDEWLVLPAMHYRWNYLDEQRDFILSEFGRQLKPDASLAEQIAIGGEFSKPFSGSLPVLGVNETTIPAIERSYLTMLEQLNTHFKTQPFLFGTRPSIGDYGLMGPLYAHLARDPYPGALMQREAPEVYAWVQRMNAPEPLSGEFLSDDGVPNTLLPLLQRQSAEQLPYTLKVIEANTAWFKENPDELLVKRSLGWQSFMIDGVESQRMIFSYAQWMFQRPLFYYQSLSGDDKASADVFLREIGAYDAFQTQVETPVVRQPGSLKLARKRS